MEKLNVVISTMKDAAAVGALSINDKEILLKYAAYLKLDRPLTSKQSKLYESVLDELIIKKNIMCEIAASTEAKGFDKSFESTYNEMMNCLKQPVRLPVETDNKLLKEFFSFYPRMDLIDLNDNTRRYKLRDFIRSTQSMQ